MTLKYMIYANFLKIIFEFKRNGIPCEEITRRGM